MDEGYEALFRAEYPSILRAMYLMTGDRAIAEDVTQDAFAALFVHWKKVSRYDKPGAWVRTVAIRTAVRARKRASMGARLEAAAPPTTPLLELDVDLQDAVLDLSDAQRAAVVLHYFEGRPLAEVAEILGCAIGTAKTHLHRARQNLAARLGEEANDVTG